MHNLRWSDLEYVLAVASNGSVAAAARALDVNHTTIMRRVQAFESQVNVRIFERLRSGYQPTAEGEIFLDAALSIDGIVNDLDRKIAGGDKRLAGPLSVTVTDSIFPLLADSIDIFHKAYPEIVIDLAITNDRLNLDRRDADIAVRASNNPPPHLVGRRICDIRFGIFATPARVREAKDLPLQKRSWLGLDHPLTASAASKWMDELIPKRRITLRSGSFVALSQLAGHGLGHAILPCHLGDGSERLVRVKCNRPLPFAGLWLLSPQGPPARTACAGRCGFHLQYPACQKGGNRRPLTSAHCSGYQLECEKTLRLRHEVVVPLRACRAHRPLTGVVEHKQRGIAAGGRRVVGNQLFPGKPQEILRAAGLGAGAGQTGTAKGLTFDDGADHVAIDIDIAVGKAFGDLGGKRLDARVDAKGQAETHGVNPVYELIEFRFFPADDVQDRSEDFLRQLVRAIQFDDLRRHPETSGLVRAGGFAAIRQGTARSHGIDMAHDIFASICVDHRADIGFRQRRVTKRQLWRRRR